MNQTLNPGTRQWELVALVAQHGPIALVELAAHLGLARTSVQQQVGRLLAAGWLKKTRRRGQPGRPADVFALSEKCRRSLAEKSSGFAQYLIDEIADTEGESKLRSLLKGTGRRMIQRLEPRIGRGTPQERASRLAETLSEEGTICDVTHTRQGLTLSIHTCPYHGLSDEHDALCDMDRQIVSRLVGAKARTTCRIADGHPRCEFQFAVNPRGVRKHSRE